MQVKLNYENIFLFVLKALVFLTPLFFLPITPEFREFNKQALIFFGVLLLLAIWVIKILTTKSASWVRTSLDYVVIFCLGVYFISCLSSIDKVSSFLGFYGKFTGSFVSILSLVILYFLVVNHVRNESIAGKITNWLSFGTFLVLGFSLFQILGVNLIPFIKDASFNPVGSMAGLTIFAAVSIVLYQWQLLSLKPSILMKVGLVIFTLVALFLMLVVNAFTGWLILALGMVAFMALGIALTQTADSAWLWKPLLILVVAILFVAFNFLPQSFNPAKIVKVDNLPLEIQLSNSATWDLVGNSLKGGAKSTLLGSGPGTMGIAFGQIKPEALNKTIVWNLSFDRGSTEVANLLVETGLLGLLAFEITCILFLIYGFHFLFKKASQNTKTYALGFFTIWIVLYLSHFFYFFSTTFYFLFWLSIGMFMAVAHWKDNDERADFSLSTSPRSALSWMFASLIVLIAVLVGGFFQGAVYAAEIAYNNGIKTLNQKNPDFDLADKNFARAISLNQYRDAYYMAYGQNLIFKASKEAAKKEPDLAKIQGWIRNIIAAGNNATRISPNKASNWSGLAQFYTSMRPLAIEGTNDAIISSWEKAVAKDSSSPALLIKLAEAYVIGAEVIDPSIAGSGVDTDQDGLSDTKEQQLGSNPQEFDSNGNGRSDGDEVRAGFNPSGTGRLSNAQLQSFTRIDGKRIKDAEDALRKAIELKDDLPETRIALARVLERTGKLSDAKKELDAAVKAFPNNLAIKFEQGRITYNQRNYTEAQRIFEDVLRANPNYADALFSLGQVYQQKGDLVKALANYKKAREISGPNIDLETLINNIETTLQK